MAAYTAIPDSQVDVESPITEQLMMALRDNPEAVAEGAASVPAGKKILVPNSMRTGETGTSKVLRPNGAGGVEWVDANLLLPIPQVFYANFLPQTHQVGGGLSFSWSVGSPGAHLTITANRRGIIHGSWGSMVNPTYPTVGGGTGVPDGMMVDFVDMTGLLSTDKSVGGVFHGRIAAGGSFQINLQAFAALASQAFVTGIFIDFNW